MTDLEKLWNDAETPPAPVDRIVGAGRLQAGRRDRLVVRPLMIAATAAAMLATFVAGTQVGDDGGAGPAPFADVRPASFQADLDPAESCSELLASYRDRAVGRVTAWGWQHPQLRYLHSRFDGLDSPSGALAGLADPPIPTGYQGEPARNLSKADASPTGTNVQEPDVDEPDTVKTDGTRVVRLRGSSLLVYEATDSGMQKVSSLHLPRLESAEILLHGDTVVAIGADRTSRLDELSQERRGSRVVSVSLQNPSKPVIASDVTYASRIISARQHGSIVRIVMAAGLPDLDFVQPDDERLTQEEAEAANREIVRSSRITDWLPTFDAGTGPGQLLECDNVAIPAHEFGLDTVSIVGIDTRRPAMPVAIGLAGTARIAYESADHLFLASEPGDSSCGDIGLGMDCDVSATGTTHLFDFELDGIEARHVASGEVEGSVADRWSLDEADGVLRIAVGPSTETGNFNSVVTMKRDGTELVELGRVDGLGPDEDLKGVRWFDDLAIVVTFREVDPLYTIDLTDPARPQLLGKLKIPGYSDYLHPVGDEQLMGIGYEGNSAQIAVFDTADLTDVRRTDVLKLDRTQALAAEEPRAFTWLPDRRTALTVVQRGRSVDLLTITVRDGRLTSRRAHVEYGDDARLVRTVQLSDGRVALVTGEDVELVDLP